MSTPQGAISLVQLFLSFGSLTKRNVSGILSKRKSFVAFE